MSNLGAVLSALAASGGASRAQLAVSTGLTKPAVSRLIENLLTAGLVEELGPAADREVKGRPGSVLRLSSTGPVGVGLEINVDFISTCTVALDGSVLDRQLVSEDLRLLEQAEVLDLATDLLVAAVERASVPHRSRPVAGIAVGVPGLVDVEQDVLCFAPNLGWRDVPVVARLRQRPALRTLPIRLDNESNLAAVGELWCGHGQELGSFVLVTGEVGVGAGIVVDGSLYRGARGFSGEVGHLCVDPNGPRCPCGARGCLEREAGQERILERAGLGGRASTRTGNPHGPTAELLKSAQAGDTRTVQAIEQAGRALGLGMASVLNVVDVRHVVLGGLYALLGPWLLPVVQEELDWRVASARWSAPTVQLAALGVEAAVRGAAVSVVRDVIANPAPLVA